MTATTTVQSFEKSKTDFFEDGTTARKEEKNFERNQKASIIANNEN